MLIKMPEPVGELYQLGIFNNVIYVVYSRNKSNPPFNGRNDLQFRFIFFGQVCVQ